MKEAFLIQFVNTEENELMVCEAFITENEGYARNYVSQQRAEFFKGNTTVYYGMKKITLYDEPIMKMLLATF